MHHASCLCGSVRFDVSAFSRPVVVCHCTMCRKVSGHYWAATLVEPQDLHWIANETIREYESSPGIKRAFCGTCGSTVYWKPDARSGYSISPGLFDGPTGLTTSDHIYVAEMGDYYALSDGIPQHAVY